MGFGLGVIHGCYPFCGYLLIRARSLTYIGVHRLGSVKKSIGAFPRLEVGLYRITDQGPRSYAFLEKHIDFLRACVFLKFFL